MSDKKKETLLTQEEFDSETRRLDLELKKLQLQTIRDDIDTKKLDQFNRLERSRQNGVSESEYYLMSSPLCFREM